LRQLNSIKHDNKPFLYFSYTQLADFFLATKEPQKSLLLLKEASNIINKDEFWSKDNLKRIDTIPSWAFKNMIWNLEKHSQNDNLGMRMAVVSQELGPYDMTKTKQAQKNKKKADEYETQFHNLIRW